MEKGEEWVPLFVSERNYRLHCLFSFFEVNAKIGNCVFFLAIKCTDVFLSFAIPDQINKCIHFMNPKLKRYLFWIGSFVAIGFSLQLLWQDPYSIRILVKDVIVGATIAFWHNSEVKEREKKQAQNNNRK